MSTSADTFDLALKCHQSGNLQQAEHFCRQILQANPRRVDAMHLLGLIAQQVGRNDIAVDYLGQVVRLSPDFIEAHNNLGNALGALGRFDEAVASYQQALRLRPYIAELHNNLGVALREQGKLEEAAAGFRRALELKPAYPEAHNNLGNILREQKKLDEAAASLRQALLLRPNDAEAHNNLGLVLAEQENLDEAVANYQQALRLKPEYPEAHLNLGTALRAQGNLQGAVASLNQALRLKPSYAEALNGLAVALGDQGNVHEAVACYQKALDLKPDYAEAHNNLGMAWLILGNFEQGWPEYEWRWQCEQSLPSFSQPRWDGSFLPDDTILLHVEQGLGDTLQFIRFAPLVKERVGKVVVACQRALVRILARCPGIDLVITQGDPLPHFDVRAPLLSVPGILKTSLATLPATVPYLFADPDLVERWRQDLEQSPGFKIGIAWQGNPKYRADRFRSIPLEQFAPLARLEGVRLLSLQKGPGTEQLAALAGRFPVTDLGSKLDEASGPFMDTAAVLKCLDLVVTSDTALAHLAGALGVPVWVALPFIPDWRWLMHREDSPWYPTMRLFRQSERGNWPAVFERIAGEVKKLLAQRSRGGPISFLSGKQPEPTATGLIEVEIAPGELIDKITILQIKSERLSDAAKLKNVGIELAVLQEAHTQALEPSEQLGCLTAELKKVNEALWQVEDDIRRCERAEDFGPRFIELARSVYRHNDRRAAVKRQINDLLGSKLVEEKGYADYTENRKTRGES